MHRTDQRPPATVHAVPAMAPTTPPIRALRVRGRACAPHRPRAARFPFPHGWHVAVGLVSAATLILAVIGGAFWWVGKPQPVNAAAILQRAIAAADPATGAQQSFHIRWQITSTLHSVGAQAPRTSVDTYEQWVSTPNRWYIVGRSQQPTGLGHTYETVEVSDGKTQWSQQTTDGDTRVAVGTLPNNLAPYQGFLTVPRIQPFGGGQFTAQDLQSLLAEAQTCYHPTLEGEAQIAGRPAYVVNLGQNTCRPVTPRSTPLPTASAGGGPPAGVGRATPAPRTTAPDTDRLWIDKASFLTLKESYTTTTAQYTQASVREATVVEQHGAIPDATFAYTPPAGARIMEYRPHAIPGRGQG